MSHQILPPGYPLEYPRPFCELSEHGEYVVPTTCFESRDETAKEDLEEAVLFAEGAAKLADMIYPRELHSLNEVFMCYDEPLYPIPVGASVFYFVLIAWVTTFYFTYLGRKLLFNMKEKLNLHPEPNKFPSLPIYWLQQSKREADLRREVRNTWAWLARRYLLSPNDPLLANVDQILGAVNWHDFEVSRNTWSLIQCVLRMNALFVVVKRNLANDTKAFEILRDRDLTRVPMEGDKVRRVFEEIIDEGPYEEVRQAKATTEMGGKKEKPEKEGQRKPAPMMEGQGGQSEQKNNTSGDKAPDVGQSPGGGGRGKQQWQKAGSVKHVAKFPKAITGVSKAKGGGGGSFEDDPKGKKAPGTEVPQEEPSPAPGLGGPGDPKDDGGPSTDPAVTSPE